MKNLQYIDIKFNYSKNESNNITNDISLLYSKVLHNNHFKYNYAIDFPNAYFDEKSNSKVKLNKSNVIRLFSFDDLSNFNNEFMIKLLINRKVITVSEVKIVNEKDILGYVSYYRNNDIDKSFSKETEVKRKNYKEKFELLKNETCNINLMSNSNYNKFTLFITRVIQDKINISFDEYIEILENKFSKGILTSYLLSKKTDLILLPIIK